MKIAFVKQDVYQDLYVGNKNMTAWELLQSSSGRVGPISLFEKYDCDFYIVKEEKNRECHTWELVTPKHRKEFRKLKTETVKSVKGMEFHEPGSEYSNGHFAVSCYDVDWGKYDIVISVNIAIPTTIVRKYTNTLWTYMIGEANFMLDKVYFGYDLCLNQLIRGEQDFSKGAIDFPYTFVGPDYLEKLLYEQYGKPDKHGIYGEINTTTERPVKRIPQFEPISAATGEKILFHKQNITKNLIEMYNAKYYLKVGGRQTRGNGAIEAISLGTLVLMSPDDIICGQILPPEAWVFDAEDATKKISYLNSNPDEYDRVLKLERELVDAFVVEYPMHWLEKALQIKRKEGPKKIVKYHLWNYAHEIMRRYKRKKNRIVYLGK